jgi:hypothetical protein
MFVSFQAFTQSIFFSEKVSTVSVFKVMELSDAEHPIIYKFLNERKVSPIQVNDTTWRIDVPKNEFSMLLFDDKEWVGIKPNNYKYDAIVDFIYDDGFMTVIEFNPFTVKYEDHFFGDLLIYLR